MGAFTALWSEVIKKGLCTACGTCIGVCPRGSIIFDFELEHPRLMGECEGRCSICYDVCPGKDVPLPDLDRMVFGRERDVVRENAGISRSYFKGYASDPEIRAVGTSGGCSSALLIYMLKEGIIDCAVVAGMSRGNPWRAESRIATTATEVMDAAKSKYVIFPHNAALSEVAKGNFRKVGFIGLPCHVQAVRKIQLLGKPRKVSERIKFVLGIVCAWNFSFKATEHMVREGANIASLDEVTELLYRGKRENTGTEITTRSGRTVTISETERRRYSFGFIRDRCLMCYDWAAELADISLADLYDATGTYKTPSWSTIAVRTKIGDRLVKEAVRAGYIKLFPIEETSFLTNVGFEWKKHGSVHRLIERRNFGWPTPNYGYQVPPPKPILFKAKHASK